ncbi:MAG: DUF4091 domain-containing protein [Ruminococcaceae bacterium]|nr:DUF4091 domain-containing protein [Oscillospiraceae bacterium]
MITTKIVSSLEKCFLDSHIEDFEAFNSFSMLKNERLSLQLLYYADLEEPNHDARMKVILGGALAPYATARTVGLVPVTLPYYTPTAPDDNYLRDQPGLYPDVLLPLHYHGAITAQRGQTRSLWIDLEPGENLPAGDHTLTITLTNEEKGIHIEEAFSAHIIDAKLPESELIFTQWFHGDCLANYYGCEVWSEKHWSIIEAFARTAVKNGINLLLTPIHTPPLDTEIGGERLTVQLVDVTCKGGVYSFGFDRLDRWIDMCDRVGIKYFEIAHFFTQWGAYHAPKIMATVDGVYQKLFGWETDATGEDYKHYLEAFIPAFLSHMKEKGRDKDCFFHISDEPNKEQLDSYRAAKSIVAPLLEGYTIMDALSNFEFWKEGIVETPIPANNHIAPFIEAEVPGLWTYYCCSQEKDVSNRFIAMPLWRTRCIGAQLYKYNITGFLHWGYNHYNNLNSTDQIDPYLEQSGEFWVPAGDTHSVYPAQDGTALESIRILSFTEALQDLSAMRLAEKICGKDTLIASLEKIFKGDIRFDRCAKDAKTVLAMREAVNAVIEGALK